MARTTRRTDHRPPGDREPGTEPTRPKQGTGNSGSETESAHPRQETGVRGQEIGRSTASIVFPADDARYVSFTLDKLVPIVITKYVEMDLKP